MVKTLGPNGETLVCSTKPTLEKAIISGNKGNYSRSTDTPPMQEYFVRDFGFDGNTPAALEVLQGTYSPPLNVTLPYGISSPTASCLPISLLNPPAPSPSQQNAINMAGRRLKNIPKLAFLASLSQ